jgi:ABC-type phosphate/phosphonate transport system permease subunit
MTEVVPQELIIEKTEQKNQQNVDKENKNKKIILWGILIVLVIIVLYVLFGENMKTYRLNTETRNNLTKINKENLPLATALTASTTSSMPVNTITNLSSTSDFGVSNTNQVRRELANLFKSYA